MHAEDPAWTLVVFARAPRAGQVKTRLIPALGVAGATRVHRALMRQTLARACAARGARVELWIAGSPDHAFVRRCTQRYPVALHQQHGADLGERIAHAMRAALARTPAPRRCVLIGSDCPAQSAQDLEQAAVALRSHDLALQPALDGGYVLIGLTDPHPALFEAIPWGSRQVCAQTEARAASLGLSVARLRALPDLDTEEDLRQALASGWLSR